MLFLPPVLCFLPYFPRIYLMTKVFMMNTVLFLFSCMFFLRCLLFSPWFACCSFYYFWWPYFVSCGFGSFRTVSCSFFDPVFLIHVLIDKNRVEFIWLQCFCFAFVFYYWFTEMLFCFPFSCYFHACQIWSTRAFWTPICLLWVTPHNKLTHSSHPHHAWTYLHI